MNPGGLGLMKTGGVLSSLSVTKNSGVPLGEPDFAVDINGLSMRVYGNSTNSSDLSDKGLQVTTIVSNNSVTGGHDYMIIMKDT
jgi:hypothetical protein